MQTRLEIPYIPKFESTRLNNFVTSKYSPDAETRVRSQHDVSYIRSLIPKPYLMLQKKKKKTSTAHVSGDRCCISVSFHAFFPPK